MFSRWLPIWLFVLATIGYSLVGLFSTITGLGSDATSIPFRIVVLILSLAALLRYIGRVPRWGRLGWLLLFWTAYAARLLWDLNAGVPGASDGLMYFTAIVFVPAVAVALSGVENVDARALAWRVAIFAGLVSALATLMFLYGWGAERTHDLEQTGGRLSFEQLNPITLGHTAVTALIAVLCLSGRRTALSARLWMLLIGAAALTCLLLSASRGPAIALAVCTLAFVLLTRRWRWGLLLVVAAVPLALQEDSAITERLGFLLEGPESGYAEDESALGRIIMQANALEQWREHPLLGSAFVELQSEHYPHNLFIETLMALGIVGAVILLPVLIRAALGAWTLKRRGELLLPLLALQYFIAAQFSGALWGFAAPWILIAAMCAVKLERRRRRRARAVVAQPIVPQDTGEARA